MIWQAFQTLVPVDAAGSGRQRLLDHLRPPAAQLVDPARRLGRAHGGAHALPRGPRLHRALRPPGDPARARGRALHGRRDRRRRALPGQARRALDHPRQAPRGDGAARARGARSSSTASTPTTSACPAWPATWPPTRRRSSRRRTARAPRSRPGTVGWPEEVLELGRAVRDRRPLRRGRPVAARGHADARGPGPRAAGPPHRQAAEPADLGPAGRRRELGRAQGDDLPAPARARAPLHPGALRRAHPHLVREEPGRHRGLEPAHDPRGLPRRRPQLLVQRGEPAGAGLGRPPHADPRPLPDRRHDERGRLGHRRAGPQRGRS